MKKFRFNPVQSVIRRLKSLDADPMKICYGFAFGVFMSTTPFIGFKWLVALPVVWLAKWNKVACLIGILQVNYLTGPAFYSLAYYLGDKIRGVSHSFQLPVNLNLTAMKEILYNSTDVLLSLLLGGGILSIPLTLLAFYGVRSILSGKLNISSS